MTRHVQDGKVYVSPISDDEWETLGYLDSTPEVEEFQGVWAPTRDQVLALALENYSRLIDMYAEHQGLRT